MDNLTAAAAAIAIMDELSCRSEYEDPVKQAIEKYRHHNGTAAWREKIAEFGIRTEQYLATLPDGMREILYDTMAWDFEWLGGVMDYLQEHEPTWYDATVGDIGHASIEYYREFERQRAGN